ncbi:uncharacterized protein LOC142592029 isoform X2 [Dermacentor variabilis]|uniref:uncharacterized protein LOC142592029 isoform X2 n=1 Tax=Dermacentor variabilis TaxID=34621 RepID=UPI003F5BCF7C
MKAENLDMVPKPWTLTSTEQGTMQRAGRCSRDFVFDSVQPGTARAPRWMMLMNLRRQRRSKESACDVGPWSSCKHKYAVCFVGNCPSQCLSVNQFFSNLRYHWIILSHRRVNHDMSCMTSTANGYFLLAERPIWNEFPSVINFELREVRPGELALVCLRSRLVSDASYMQHRYSFGLVHWLLMKHYCINFVEPSESHVTHNHFLLLHDFWLSCNLANVKLHRDRSDDYLPKDLVDALHSTATTLDTLEIMSARFFGLHMLCEMLGRCRSSDRLREYMAYLVGSCLTLRLPVNQLFSNMRYLRSILTHRQVNHDNWRTASDANIGFLLAELSLWNEFLLLNFDLRAVSAGRLFLTCSHRRVVPVSSNIQRRYSFVRVQRVPMKLRLIKFLELCEPRISQNHFMIRDGLRLWPYTSYVKVIHYQLEYYSPRYLTETLHSPLTTLDTMVGVCVGFSNFGVQLHAVRATRQL